jgi:hypothetical protein
MAVQGAGEAARRVSEVGLGSAAAEGARASPRTHVPGPVRRAPQVCERRSSAPPTGVQRASRALLKRTGLASGGADADNLRGRSTGTAAQSSAGSERRAQTHRPALHKHCPRGGRSGASRFGGRAGQRSRGGRPGQPASPRAQTRPARTPSLREPRVGTTFRSATRAARLAEEHPSRVSGAVADHPWTADTSSVILRELEHSARQKSRK